MTEPPYTSSAKNGLLVVVSGPSAVGKDTVLDVLLTADKLPYPVQKCVTATTRPARPQETDGIAYHFVTAAKFNSMVASDDFLEYAEVHEGWYGTPRAWVQEKRLAGVDVILKIDVQGALNVRQQSPDAVLVFLQPPSLQELERRLRQRRSESDEQIAKRLLNARSELNRRTEYDYAVTNDSVDQAVDAIRSILIAEHCRIRKSADVVRKATDV